MKIWVSYPEMTKGPAEIELPNAPREGDKLALVPGGPAYTVTSVVFQPKGSPCDVEIQAILSRPWRTTSAPVRTLVLWLILIVLFVGFYKFFSR